VKAVAVGIGKRRQRGLTRSGESGLLSVNALGSIGSKKTVDPSGSSSLSPTVTGPPSWYHRQPQIPPS